MGKKYENIPTRLATDQLLRVLAEQGDEMLSLMREQNRILKGEKGDGIPVTQAVELAEPKPEEKEPPAPKGAAPAAKAPAKPPARSGTTGSTRKS